MAVDHIAGHTYHGRKGTVQNGFRYSIDYVLLDAEGDADVMFRRWPFSVLRRDHGGPPKSGRGAEWALEVLAAQRIRAPKLSLLTQPRVLGYVFNPVSFWLAQDEAGDLVAVIAEVTNTFGDRHSYLCRKPDGSAIKADDHIAASKIFHVSPFQPVDGGYVFRFDIRRDRIGIWIDFEHGAGGVIATLVGKRVPLTRGGMLRALWRRPLGARRVMALIHWQAIKLKLKGARYRRRPEPPTQAVSGPIEEVRG
ncbi:DUF1365 domain-containing protein [Primorskyibacter sp. 2E107]|uniref:DUF1365 domain-containing protein n=1 Tax=Primorskyibacter sp. 2E107 TaxID=3403458 RepID=UPI003AF4B37E